MMKKKTIVFLFVLIAIIMFFSSVTGFAAFGYEYGISLCYRGNAYSVDYVFDVPVGTEILSVVVDDKNCSCEWSYLESESKLYISISSESAIAKSKKIATVNVSTERTFLAPISLVVNGNIIDTIYTYHSSVGMDYVAPGIDTSGHFGGQKCGNCDIVVIDPVIIPAKGPIIRTNLSNNGILTVSGALSDSERTDGTTFISIYDIDNKMIALENITFYNQSDFSITIENVKNAYKVKILRWNMQKLMPLNDFTEVVLLNS